MVLFHLSEIILDISRKPSLNPWVEWEPSGRFPSGVSFPPLPTQPAQRALGSRVSLGVAVSACAPRAALSEELTACRLLADSAQGTGSGGSGGRQAGQGQRPAGKSVSDASGPREYLWAAGGQGGGR